MQEFQKPYPIFFLHEEEEHCRFLSRVFLVWQQLQTGSSQIVAGAFSLSQSGKKETWRGTAMIEKLQSLRGDAMIPQLERYSWATFLAVESIYQTSNT
jgi:hypothetical protein